MATKFQKLLRLLLLIPYFAWGIALLFVSLVSGSAGDSLSQNAFFDVIMGIASFYTIGIVVWGIPYTILTLGLLLWSIKKPAPTIYKGFVISPFLLCFLTVVEVALIVFWPLKAPFLESMKDFLSYTLIAVIPSLVFGYVFVGIGILIYKAMSHFKVLRTEAEAK